MLIEEDDEETDSYPSPPNIVPMRKCRRSDSRPLQDADMADGSVDRIFESEGSRGGKFSKYDNFFTMQDVEDYGTYKMCLLRATTPLAIVLDLILTCVALTSVYFGTFRGGFGEYFTLSPAIYVLDFIYAMLVLSKLTTSQVDLTTGNEHVLQSKVFRRVTRSKIFYVDVFSILPWEFASANSHSRNVLCMCRLLPRSIRATQGMLLDQLYPSTRLNVLYLVVCILASGHFVGCIWYSIVKNDSQALALATNVDDPELRTWQVVYAASYKMGVYLLLGMDRDGLCSDAANLLYENVLLCFAAPFGALVHAAVFGQIAQLIAKSQSLERQHIEQKMAIEKAVTTLCLPEALRTRIMSFVLYQQIHRSHVTFSQLFHLLSQQLKFELNLALYHDLVRQSALFLNAGSSFVKAVVLCLVDHIFLQNDFICRVGEDGLEMYFVVKGTVTVFSKLGIPLTSLHTGATFGEVSLLTRSKRNAFVRADAYVVLAILAKEHFDPIVERFPVEMAKMLAQVNDERRQSTSTGSIRGLSNEKALARKFSLMGNNHHSSSSGMKHGMGTASASSSRRSSNFCTDFVSPIMCPTFSAGELRRSSVMSTSSALSVDEPRASTMLAYDKRRFSRDIGQDSVRIPSRRRSDGTVPEGRRMSRLVVTGEAPETAVEDDMRGIPVNMKPLVEAFRDMQLRFAHIQGLIDSAADGGISEEDDFNLNDDETIL